MKTDQLIDLLATGVTPVVPRAASRMVQRASLIGLAGALLILMLFYGPRKDLASAMHWPMFWLKLGAPVVVALAGAILVARLGRPGVSARHWVWLAVAPVLVLWGLALVQWSAAVPAERPALLWGQTWRTCLWSVGLIGTPVFAAALWALRDLAPTRARQAGAAAGLLAGGVGAGVYALHCPELTAPFIAVWYVLGMALPVAAGWWLGPRVLRW
jgi:hypothetical protein